MTLGQRTGDIPAPGTRRNDPCPCGSGRRYKHCCGAKPDRTLLREAGLGDADGHYRRALALERSGRDEEAIGELQRAVAIDTDHASALERLGNLLTKRGDRDAAIACYRRAASARPDGLVGQVSLAKVMMEESRHAEAEALLCRTTAQFAASAEAKRLLASVLREQGRFDEAIPLLIEATQGTPVEAATAYYDLALSKRIIEADVPDLERMRALLALDTLPETTHPRLHFALGKAHDDLGAYAEAMTHFDAANCIVRRAEPFDGARAAAAMQGLMATFTAEFIAARAALGSSSDAPLLILGMPRSGTTLVEQVLSSHPDVAGGGELGFWNDKAEAFARNGHASSTAAGIAGMAAEYAAILHRIGPHAVRITDKSPSNFLWIGLIRSVFPRARIIHCRRHPVDTCLSIYFTHFGTRMPFAHGKADLALYYRHYAELMAHWRSLLPPDYFREVDYEQLVTDPETVTRGLIDFCGLGWDDACLRPEANRRMVRTASLWQVRQPIFGSSIGRWRHYEPWLGQLRGLLDSYQPPSTFGPGSTQADRVR